jgi:hypothetical protein
LRVVLPVAGCFGVLSNGKERAVAKNPATFRLTSLVIFPSRSAVAEGASRGMLAGDDEPTRFELHYSETFALTPTMTVPTGTCTFIHVDFPQRFSGSEEEFEGWLRENTTRLIRDEVLRRVNYFLAIVQAADDDPYRTIALRDVGELDLFFHNLTYGETVVFSRGTPSFFGALDAAGEDRAAIPSDLPPQLAPEWLLLTRAAHLVNHGFQSEAVLVAFSLLDLKVQEFLTTRFPNLSTDEGGELLRVVESRRLNRYLGLMMRLCTGASPLDTKDGADELAWLNRLRNGLIHDAEACSIADAQRALLIVKRLLEFLNEYGAGLTLPPVLRFWTPDVPNVVDDKTSSQPPVRTADT